MKSQICLLHIVLYAFLASHTINQSSQALLRHKFLTSLDTSSRSMTDTTTWCALFMTDTTNMVCSVYDRHNNTVCSVFFNRHNNMVCSVYDRHNNTVCCSVSCYHSYCQFICSGPQHILQLLCLQ